MNVEKFLGSNINFFNSLKPLGALFVFISSNNSLSLFFQEKLPNNIFNLFKRYSSYKDNFSLSFILEFINVSLSLKLLNCLIYLLQYKGIILSLGLRSFNKNKGTNSTFNTLKIFKMLLATSNFIPFKFCFTISSISISP